MRSQFTSTSNLGVLALLLTGVGMAVPATATASDVGNAIGQQVDIDNYRHYLEDLLYTHLGDNRGFGAEHDAAQSNIRFVLSSLGLPVALEPFSYSGSTYYNIVATQTGIDHPDEIVIVGAHFDSVNNPGADDNGTGTALVMEMARVLSTHRASRTIKYVLFDREEQGRVGSQAFVSTHSSENIVMAVTADMIGHDSGQYAMDIYGTPSSSSVINGVAGAIDTYGDGLGRFLNVGTFAFSDHWSFESAGIPACVIIERCYQCNNNYHTQNDAVDIAPDYITYPMVEDLLHSVAGYLVDTVGVTIYGDTNADGFVDVQDLLNVILGWGMCPLPPDPCPNDFDGNGDVNVTDLLTVILNWDS